MIRLLDFDSVFSLTVFATSLIYTLSLHDALPIFRYYGIKAVDPDKLKKAKKDIRDDLSNEILKNNKIVLQLRSEEHTSELQSRGHLVCRLLLEKKKKQ